MSDDMKKLQALQEKAKAFDDDTVSYSVPELIGIIKGVASLDISRIAAAVEYAEADLHRRKIIQTDDDKEYADAQERVDELAAAYRARWQS